VERLAPRRALGLFVGWGLGVLTTLPRIREAPCCGCGELGVQPVPHAVAVRSSVTRRVPAPPPSWRLCSLGSRTLSFVGGKPGVGGARGRAGQTCRLRAGRPAGPGRGRQRGINPKYCFPRPLHCPTPRVQEKRGNKLPRLLSAGVSSPHTRTPMVDDGAALALLTRPPVAPMVPASGRY
jgi:hypothetical protein